MTSRNVLGALVAALCSACPLQVPVQNGPNDTVAAVVAQDPDLGQPIAGTTKSLATGRSFTIGIAGKDAAGNAVAGITPTASSDNTSVATVAVVSAQVTVTTVGAGTAHITITVGSQTVTFTVVVTTALTDLKITGLTTAALGGQNLVLTAGASPAGTEASTTWTLSGNTDVATIVGGTGTTATGATLTLQVGGPGTVAVTASLGGRTASTTLTFTASAVSIAPKSATVLIGTPQTYTATVTGIGGVSGLATHTTWTATGQCSLSAQTGASVQVTPSSTVACTVGASVPGAVASSSTVTGSVAQDIVITPGAQGNLTIGATRTYTAQVMVGGSAVQGAAVTWSYVAPGSVIGGTSVFSVTSAGVVTGTGIGAATLQAAAGGITRTASVTVAPASLAWQTATVSAQTGSQQTLQLLAKNSAGGAAPIAVAPVFGQGGVTLSMTPAFVAAPTAGATLGLTGSLVNLPVTVRADVGQHVGTATWLGVTSDTLTVNVSAPPVPDALSLAFKPGLEAPDSSSMTVSPHATAAGSDVSGITVGISLVSGDTNVVTSALPVSIVTPNNTSINLGHLGTVVLHATSTSPALTSASYTIYSEPAGITLASATPALATLQLGTPGTASWSLRGLNNVLIALDAEEAANGAGHWGSLAVTSQDPSVLAVSSCARTGGNWGCTLTPGSTAGATTLHVTWSSADNQKHFGPVDFAATVNAAPAPTWSAAGNYTATWTGATTYALSFPEPTNLGSQAVTYMAYESSAAGADTNDNVLFGSGNGNVLTATGSGTVTASFVTSSFSSRRSMGIKAKYANSTLSVAQRLTITTQAPAASNMVAILAGRTVLELGLDKSLRPLYVVSPASLSGATAEKTAPRFSSHGYTGILVNAQGQQQTYTRAAASTGLAQAGSGPIIQTDQTLGCASAPVRPTVALAGSLGGGFPVYFATTPQFADCTLAELVYVSGATGKLAVNRLVTQAAPNGDNSIALYDGSRVSLLSVSGATITETQADTTYTGGGVLAADPLGSILAYTYDPTNGLVKWDFDAGAGVRTQVATQAELATAGLPPGTPKAMAGVKPTVLALELNAPGTGGTSIYSIDFTGALAVTPLVSPADVGGDSPTLGASTSAGQ